MNKLYQLTNKFRTALEQTSPNCFNGHISLSAARFPRGCCDDASMLLAAYFVDNGYKEIKKVKGTKGGKESEIKDHVWLLTDNIHIDITADQFNLGHDYDNPRIIFDAQNDFLRTFTTKIEENADFRKSIPEHNNKELLDNFNQHYCFILSLIK